MTFSKRRSVRALLATVGVAAVLATSACSANADTAGSDSTGSTLLVAADAGSPTFTRNFNPFATTHRATQFMYEPLEVLDTLNGKLTPFLATGETMPNSQEVVFTIRHGVKWSDGKPFTPADVAFTFNLIKKTPALDTLGVWQSIASLNVEGDTVVFHLKSPDVPAASLIAQQIILPEHIWKNVRNPLTWTNPSPVVTGPYVLGSFAPNEYTLKKNPTYWQSDKVAATKIVFPATDTTLDLVKKGYDWAYSFIPDVKGTWVKANPSHNKYWFPVGGTIALVPNLTKAPYNNLNFREGISYALDRDKIGKDAEQGYMTGAAQTGLLPSEQTWLDPSLPKGGVISQNTAKALQYFAKAGYTRKNGKLVDSSGKQLTITITTPNGYTDWLQGLQTVQSELGALGINVTLNQPQPAAAQQAFDTGEFDMGIEGFGGSGSVYQDFNLLLNSSFATPVGTTTSANFERFDDPKADALLKQYLSATTESAQKSIAYQLEQVVYNQLPVISVWGGGLWGLYSTQHFTGWPSASNPYSAPITWSSEPLLILTHLKVR